MVPRAPSPRMQTLAKNWTASTNSSSGCGRDSPNQKWSASNGRRDGSRVSKAKKEIGLRPRRPRSLPGPLIASHAARSRGPITHCGLWPVGWARQRPTPALAPAGGVGNADISRADDAATRAGQLRPRPAPRAARPCSPDEHMVSDELASLEPSPSGTSRRAETAPSRHSRCPQPAPAQVGGRASAPARNVRLDQSGQPGPDTPAMRTRGTV